MGTLIKHELKPLSAYGVLLLLCGGFLIITIPSTFHYYAENQFAPIGIPAVFFPWFLASIIMFLLQAGGLGITQMGGDRRRKASGFLVTLATTRRRLLGAKLLVGLAWNLAAVFLTTLSWFIVLALYPRLVPINYFLLFKMAGLLFLMNAAAYSLGLWGGWSEHKAVHFFVFLLAILTPIAVVVIKGLGWECYGLLSAVTLAMLVNVWQRYMRMPL